MLPTASIGFMTYCVISMFLTIVVSVIVLAAIASRPGQCGRADGYILEGKELEFYLKKIKNKKSK